MPQTPRIRSLFRFRARRRPPFPPSRFAPPRAPAARRFATTILPRLLLAFGVFFPAIDRASAQDREPPPAATPSPRGPVGELLPTGPMADDPARARAARATVMVRKGGKVGTGSVIASVRDQTLVLTAWHVVAPEGELSVELHRYNLGRERERLPEAEAGAWPRVLPARVVAVNRDCDLAILRVALPGPLPFVVPVELQDREPPEGAPLVSIGLDAGTKLVAGETRSRGLGQINFGRGGGPRLFIVTDRPPQPGRSGGGLFRAEDMVLVGVAVGRMSLERTNAGTGAKTLDTYGVFAPARDVADLLAAHDLDLLVAESQRLAARRAP